jgi:hypothetical protein
MVVRSAFVFLVSGQPVNHENPISSIVVGRNRPSSVGPLDGWLELSCQLMM